MKRKIFFGLLAFQILNSYSIAQTPAEMQDWLRKNITVYYLPDPNTSNPEKDFRRINPLEVAKSENGIVFGKTDNNGMDRNALLLISLFKEKSNDPKMALIQGKDGDLKFQETMYYAMQITGKPITLFFINDVSAGLQAKYISQYRFYLIGNLMRWAVWPGAFQWQSPYSGAIATGEFAQFTLQNYKEMFVAMTAQIGLSDFNPAKRTSIDRLKLIEGEEGDGHLFTAGTNDIRRITNQGIANSFSLYFSELMRNQLDKWKTNGGYYYLTKVWTRSAEDLSVSEELPASLSLKNKLVEYNKQNTGYKIDEKNAIFFGLSGNAVTAIFSDFYYYIEDKQRFRYNLLSDLHLGEICYQFMKIAGIKKFIEVLKYNNNEFLKASSSQKTALLFQNMTMVMLGGRNLEHWNDVKPTDGQIFLGVALFDYYGYGLIRFPKKTLDDDGIGPQFMKRTGGQWTASEFVITMAHYVEEWEDKLREALKNKAAGQTDLDAIAFSLGIK